MGKLVKLILPWLLALAAFLGVGYYVGDSLVATDLRNAEGARDLCYRVRGFPIDGPDAVTGEIPSAIMEECTRPIQEFEDAWWPYGMGALAGLAAALVILGLFWGIRRATALDTDDLG